LTSPEADFPATQQASIRTGLNYCSGLREGFDSFRRGKSGLQLNAEGTPIE
jgi:hypothetical protein